MSPEMKLSSLYGLFDLLTNIDDEIEPETIRNTAVLGLVLVSELEDEFKQKHSSKVLPIRELTR